MRESARLALSFDAQRLQADLARLASGEWTPHFNRDFFEGDWSGIPLRVSPSDRGLYSSGASAAEDYAGTEALEACPYFQEVLGSFECPLKSVRLLRLAAGSIIREHTDASLGEEEGDVRLHIPVVTNPRVEFYLAGKRVAMQAGDCWYLDLSLPHRVQNLGESERVHLVIDCVLNDWLRGLIGNPLPESGVEDARTGAAALQAFAPQVLDDVSLIEIEDREEFLREVVRRGKGRGFVFTTEDVRAGVRVECANDPGEGWIPHRAVWDGQHPWIEWCYVGSARFTEPFFQDTIAAAMRRPFSAGFFRRTRLEDDAAWQDPAGLIFHMSRCGSTLVAQMLKAIEGITVFSEPPVLDTVVRAGQAEWVRAMVRALGSRRCQYFVKLDCWHVLDLARFRRAFPKTPCIFLHRDSAEVLASHAAQPGEWTIPGYLDSKRFGFDACELEPADLAGYRERLLAGMLRSVAESGEEVRWVNYSELPAWSWTEMPAFFGLAVGASDLERMRETARWDSKRPGMAFTSGDKNRAG
ncbi:MAG TPA: aspartyl/asparaginyl beta-hydroxylase domain-containing protein [Bryobacteraceae bacterium]|nr:aspartyl/asparaginyl beta-hydroxylase domain-containing protein [Bryobacteraceae bacterium]